MNEKEKKSYTKFNGSSLLYICGNMYKTAFMWFSNYHLIIRNISLDSYTPMSLKSHCCERDTYDKGHSMNAYTYTFTDNYQYDRLFSIQFFPYPSLSMHISIHIYTILHQRINNENRNWRSQKPNSREIWYIIVMHLKIFQNTKKKLYTHLLMHV